MQPASCEAIAPTLNSIVQEARVTRNRVFKRKYLPIALNKSLKTRFLGW
ncbi:hypothetical protein [Microcoleus sp. ARI1-A3]